MYHPFIINKSSHKLARSLLRNRMTTAETLLWEKLRHKQLGYWFKRQVSINKFIVDFYCPKIKLVVELDGGIHKRKNQSEYDKQRDWYLKSMNFKVLRFWNQEVENDLDKVLDKIKQELTPSPRLGEGVGGWSIKGTKEVIISP